MESNLERRGGVNRRLTINRRKGSYSRKTRSAAFSSPAASFSTRVSRDAGAHVSVSLQFQEFGTPRKERDFLFAILIATLIAFLSGPPPPMNCFRSQSGDNDCGCRRGEVSTMAQTRSARWQCYRTGRGIDRSLLPAPTGRTARSRRRGRRSAARVSRPGTTLDRRSRRSLVTEPHGRSDRAAPIG